MSNPEDIGSAATPDNPSENSNADKQLTLEEQLAIAEKRRKDTQAGYTKSRQAIKALEAEKAELLKQLEQVSKVNIPKEDQERLEELKYEDPEAWREEVNKIEQKVTSESRARLEELTGEARKAAEINFELDRRQQVLSEFNASAETPITDEIIANEVPPRITKKLELGEVTFEEFLEDVAEYLGKGKAVKNEKTLDQPNLSELSGGTKPSDYKPEESLSSSYAKTIF